MPYVVIRCIVTAHLLLQGSALQHVNGDAFVKTPPGSPTRAEPDSIDAVVHREDLISKLSTVLQQHSTGSGLGDLEREMSSTVASGSELDLLPLDLDSPGDWV